MSQFKAKILKMVNGTVGLVQLKKLPNQFLINFRLNLTTNKNHLLAWKLKLIKAIATSRFYKNNCKVNSLKCKTLWIKKSKKCKTTQIIECKIFKTSNFKVNSLKCKTIWIKNCKRCKTTRIKNLMKYFLC